jgi:hypothetical protein
LNLSTDVAAVALGIERKTLDNVLAREARSLVDRGRRGRRRRIPLAALERIALALVLSRDLGVGIARGLELAEAVLDSPSAAVRVGTLTTLTVDLVRLRETFQRSVGEALESLAERTRGRPRS